MRRLITLLLAAAATTAVIRAIAHKRASGSEEKRGPSVMPRPTAPPVERTREEPEPVHETNEPSRDESGTAETPGPIDEGESGAITAAPVPEEPAPEPAPAPDDSELERAVESKIAEDPAVETESVDVDVEGGVAQLRGSVPDEQTALRVGDDAARVEGVIGLDDQIDRDAEETAESEAARPSEDKGDEDE